MNLSLSDKVFLAAGLGLGIAIVYGVTRAVNALPGALSGAVDFAGTKLNPASPENVIYKDVVTPIVRTVSGSSDDTLGTWLHRVFNPSYDKWDPNAPAPAAGDWSEWNPN
jgi:hypothetical protein